MRKASLSAVVAASGPIDLVPRMKAQGYTRQDVDRRRAWLEAKTGCRFPHISSYSIASEEMRGNIENPIGTTQMPLGVAGPLLVHGTHARGTFYVPLATTEGALVRSYERGMVALSRAGGASARVYMDENRVSPVFLFQDVSEAHDFVQQISKDFDAIRDEAGSSTRHGELLRLECYPIGREVIVNFCYFTADAQGMNMIAKATEQACQWIMRHSGAQRMITAMTAHPAHSRRTLSTSGSMCQR